MPYYRLQEKRISDSYYEEFVFIESYLQTRSDNRLYSRQQASSNTGMGHVSNVLINGLGTPGLEIESTGDFPVKWTKNNPESKISPDSSEKISQIQKNS